jgi:hypothetical protein
VTSVVAEDDRVALTLDLRLPQRNGDRVITTQFASFFILRKGRIHVYRQFMDSLDAVQQKLQCDLADELRRGVLV